LRILSTVLSALLVISAVDVSVLMSRIKHFDMVPTVGAAGQTWVVVGSDSRADLPAGAAQSSFGSTTQVSGARADVVLVVHRGLDGHVWTLSIPRDMLMHNQSGQINRLTLTFDVSPQNLVDSLCSTLGIPTDHLIVVDFAVFTSVVDVLGGITVTTPTPLRDTYAGLALPQGGTQRLDGNQALALVRSRHTEEMNSGRWVSIADGAAQRTAWSGVIFSSIERAATAAADPVVVQRLAWHVSGEVVTDQHTSMADLATLAGETGPVVDVPADPITGGLAVQPSDQTYSVLAAAGFDRGCH
jgi:LCP family protein required for cell wall assembly